VDPAVYAFYANLVIAGAIEGMMIALAAMVVTLVFGIARFPNAATGDYMTLGAYAALGAHAVTGSLILASLAGMAASASTALLFYWTVFRKLAGRSVVALLIASIGIAFLVRSVLSFFLGYEQRVFQVPIVRALRFGEIRINPLDLRLSAVAAATLAIVFAILYWTPVGRRMRAVADNRELARASGIDAGRVMLALWALTGAIAAVAGIMLGLKTVVAPELGWEMLLPAFAAAILGGVGNPVGAVVAGILLGVAQELSTPLVGFTYKLALAFVVLLVVLLLRPQGLFGRIEAVR
jgi:branched-chain amino acid transport system permease protein